jgi:hypothetical protein
VFGVDLGEINFNEEMFDAEEELELASRRRGGCRKRKEVVNKDLALEERV